MSTSAFRSQAYSEPQPILDVGYEQYAAATGLRTLLGFIYLDEDSSDVRLANFARELGLTGAAGEEDEMLRQLSGGIWDVSDRPKRPYFLAMAPLGHVALRLYVSRYFCQRPPADNEFIYRVKLALRQDELDLAAVGFMRDDATKEEVVLMRGAKDANDSYAFAFECLLGHLALNAPYRLHQVLANFGWARSLPGT